MPVLTGDVYVATYTSPGGAPLLPGSSVVATVTQPDGTTVTPAVTISGSGATAIVGAPQPGDYLIVWSVSGLVTDVEQDQFTALAPRLQLLSLSDLRDELNLVTSDAVGDAKLRRWLTAAAGVVENVCGPILARPRTDIFDGGIDTIVLPFRWVRSITSVLENRGSTQFPVTEQPLGSSPRDAFGYTWDRSTNALVRRDAGSGVTTWALGEQNIAVSYVLGMATIPTDIQMATARLISHWYEQSEAPGQMTIGYPGEGGDMTRVGNYLVPNAVMELLRAWARRPGIF